MVSRAVFGEFMGTLILILMGNGVVAGVLLRKSVATPCLRSEATQAFHFAQSS